MASTSFSHRWKYDVFVSFRGEDIRKNFMDHLFENFRQKGIRAFRDDNELPRGEEISPELYKAIDGSRFLLVIFSKNYASSSWCLRELVKILECSQIKDPKHEVRPIFYDVKPSVVRKQTESYAEAFVEHDSSNRTEAAIWREALSMAGNLSGWDLHDMTNGYEFKFIDIISKEILQSLHPGPLHVGENLVGVYDRVDKANLLDFVGSNKVHIIGICGIGGIGKTTFAKAIYNMLYAHFEECIFCEDVQGTAKRHGLAQVQMQVIDGIMKTRAVTVSNVSQGAMEMKRALTSKRILLILDDVDHSDQIDALAGSPSWFFPGSMIIFTCKDKQLLSFYKMDEVDAIYDMGYLGDDEALEVFSLHAFGEENPNKDFEELANQVVKYVQGHPLSLKVLGRFLSNKTMSEWKSELCKLQVHPNANIQKVLRLSFDGLDFNQKRIFLDIAYAFLGEDKDVTARVLDSCIGFADTDIRVLANKFLISISSSNKLQMHELIQIMAREIVREESNMHGKSSRLWIQSKALKEIEVTEAVEVLVVVLKEASEDVHIDGKAFSRMKKLRILKIYDPQASFLDGDKVKYTGKLEFLSNKLSLFCWHGFPFTSLPTDFYPETIVVIDLSYSRVKKLWRKAKCFERLKVMKLSCCRNLKSTPDFTKFANLEELYLDDCVKLVKVHPSIGRLNRLVVLSMRNCILVKSFRCTFEMESLQVMDLSGCSKVDKFPEIVGTVKNLVELRVDGTAIMELPSFVSSLSKLQVLSFGGHEKIGSRQRTSISRPSLHPQSPVIPSLVGLCSLRELYLSYCNVIQVPDSIGGLSCLENLWLTGNNFTSLPGSLSHLHRLVMLVLNDCKKLEVLHNTPPKIKYVFAKGCTSLQEVHRPIFGKHSPRSAYYDLSGCPKLRNVSRIEEFALIGASSFISHFLKGFINQRTMRKYLGYNAVSMVFDGSIGGGIPEWFRNQSRGDDDAKVELPQSGKIKGFATCVVCTRKRHWSVLPLQYHIKYTPKPFSSLSLLECNMKYADGTSFRTLSTFIPNSICRLNHDTITWLYYKTGTCGWEKAKGFVTFAFKENEFYEVKEFGVRFICEEEEEEDMDLYDHDANVRY